MVADDILFFFFFDNLSEKIGLGISCESFAKADDSHEMPNLIFFSEKNTKICNQNVVCCSCDQHFKG